MIRSLLVLILCQIALGCALFDTDPDSIGNAKRETVGRHLDLAEADLEAQNYAPAVERLLATRQITGQIPEDRARGEQLLERCVDELLAEMTGDEFDSDDLLELSSLDLSPRLRARAGVRAAEKMLTEDHRVKAYRTVKKIEQSFPSHQERALAGDVVARAGLSMAREGGRYYLLFSYRSRGVEALEFLVLTYPFDEHCAEAYDVLASLYENSGQLNFAIQRYEDLLVYHPDSSYAIAAEARVPYLRMLRLQRDDYDRNDLLQAKDELTRWLERHAGNEQEGDVQETLSECHRRLASNDLVLADYYEEIGNAFGAREHAKRALEEAQAGSASEEENRARALLESLGSAPEPGTPVESGDPR